MKIIWFLFHVGLFQILVVNSSVAQDKTMYFMGIDPLSNELNPAYSYDRPQVIINPAFSVSLANSSLTFHNMFNIGKGAQDTLLYWDFDTMEKKLKNTNFFISNASINYLFAGIVLKNRRYASLSISGKFNALISYPGSFVRLRFGNADLANNKPRTIDLNNYAVDGTLYTEYSFGFSKAFSDKFSAGIHLKMLHGKMAVKTTRFLASVATSNDFSQSVLKTDARMELSAPVLKKESGENEIEVELLELKKQLSWDYISLKNYGAAADAGFILNFNGITTLSGSVLDLGMIRWAASPQQLVSEGEYIFDGLYFRTGDFEDFNADNYFKAYTDTLRSVFLPDKSDKPFNTKLIAKSYLGATFRVKPDITFSTLLKSTFLPDILLVEFTAATIWSPVKKISLSANWSYSNYSFYNFGLGAVFRGKKLQVYAATDNINSIDILNSRGINFAFGINWLIFSKEKAEEQTGKEEPELLPEE